MKLSIQTLASQCIFQHQCLNQNEFKPGEVKEFLNQKVLFVNCKQRICGYSLNFGCEKVCFCPTRKEIFKKYNV